MDFKNTQIFNFEGALRGMRNPLNSWDKSDSGYRCIQNENNLCDPHCTADNYCDNKMSKFVIGENDLGLAQRLINAGPEHAKFMRQIFVSVDITAPRYWWPEMDQYKIGTTTNSTSTMHKLISEPITGAKFKWDKGNNLVVSQQKITHGGESELVFDDYIDEVIDMCETLRKKYIETKDKRYWRALIQILPQSWLQTRTWTANYAILRNIYFQRKNHKLIEWHQFCNWIKNLPYGKELITLGDENES